MLLDTATPLLVKVLPPAVQFVPDEETSLVVEYAVVEVLNPPKDVFCTLPASKAVYKDASGVVDGVPSNGFVIAMSIALQYKE